MNDQEHDDLPPVYRDGNETYYPDNSMPVVRAARAGRLHMTALARGHYADRRLPEGILPGLKTIGCIHAVLDKQLQTGEHRNEGLELHYVESGRKWALAGCVQCLCKGMPDTTLNTACPSTCLGAARIQRGKQWHTVEGSFSTWGQWVAALENAIPSISTKRSGRQTSATA